MNRRRRSVRPFTIIAVLAVVAGLMSTATAAALPPFEDSIAQRTLACSACHGRQGRAAPDGYYPRIAGKPAGYLYNQLLNFRDGRRHFGPMQHMVDPLSDDYLREIAGYFSTLDLPYPAPAPSTAPAALFKRGETLALEGDAALRVPACVRCHGEKLTGSLPAVPGLLGLPPDYLNAQLGAWRTGERRAGEPDCMAAIAQRLNLEDISAVAAWLAARPLPADTHPASGLPDPMPLECGSNAPPTAQAPR